MAPGALGLQINNCGWVVFMAAEKELLELTNAIGLYGGGGRLYKATVKIFDLGCN